MHVEAQRIEYWEFEIARLESEIRDREYDGKDTSDFYKELREAKERLRSAKGE